MSKKRKSGIQRYGDPRRRKPVAGDLERFVQPTGNADPRRLGGAMVDLGGPHERGAVLLDLTDAVNLESAEVCVVDAVRQGAWDGEMLFMTLAGRVNKTSDRVQVGYIMSADGGAAIITELLALAERAGPDLLDEVTRRLTDLHRGKTVDLHWLRGAIDNAIGAAIEAVRCAVNARPPVLIVDDPPASGLSPAVREQIGQWWEDARRDHQGVEPAT